MKILVVSLLRLGDFLQHVPVLEALGQRYHTRHIDVLTFKPVAALHPMLPTVRHWWTLDREELQAGLGEAQIPLLTSFDVLREQLEKISAADYDLVINLTQTEFSASLMGYINAKEKLGLTFGPHGQALFHSPWFRYLDQHAQVVSEDIFNYSDIFFQACSLQGLEKTWPLKSTDVGEDEVAVLELVKGRPTLVVQLFTSDTKKTWSESSWIKCLRRLRAQHSDWQILLLASPAERERAMHIADQSGTREAILSLDGALALLNRADVLLTGDTSIKHLANASKVRVIEMSFGPSDLLRTGVYKQDSLILQPRLACAPCPHSSPCSQSTHACAQLLAPDVVASATELFMNEEWTKLSDLARISAPVSFLRTRHLQTGFWFASELTPSQPLRSVENLLDRCTIKFMLNQEFKRKIVEFGSEGVHLDNEIQRLFPVDIRQPLLAHLDFMDKELSRKRDESAFQRDGFARGRAGQDSIDLGKLRQAQTRFEDETRQSEIKVKLIRSLRSRLMESI